METTLALTDFLLARIADTQAEAIELGRLKHYDAAAAARARLIQTEAAHRRIVNAALSYSPALSEGDDGEAAFDEVLRILAAAHADHPDYRGEWRG